MKVILSVLMLLVMSSSMAAKNRDVFGSRLKSKIIQDHRRFSARSLANTFLSKKQCSKLAVENLKRSRKTIKSFALGTKIKSIDINGEYTPLSLSEDYGHYAKLGLSDDNEYLVSKLNTQYAIHSDERCARYAKVTKVDRTVYKGMSCRRIHLKLGSINYKTFFCKGDRKGYVDHYNLTSAI